MWNAAGSYGISIDFEGYVWAVASGSTASKIDPVTGQFLTGYALSNVGTPSG